MRLLFITSNRLGDAILSTGVLAYFLKQYPDADVTVVCGKVPAPLFRAVPGLQDILTVEKERYALHWLRPFTQLFATRWDVMVDLRDVAVMKMLRAKNRVFGTQASGKRHRLEDYAEMLGTPGDVPLPVFWFDAAAEAKAAQLIPEGGPVIAVAPVTGPKRKLWRPERYAAVLNALTGAGGPFAGARCAIFAAPDERERAEALVRLLPAGRTLDLIGATDPLEAAAALKRCSFFVGVDSGLMHVAAALDVPTVGLFGEQGVPQVYRPWGRYTAYVHRRNPNWTMEDKPSSMDGIMVDEVIRTCEALAARLPGAPVSG